MSTDNRTELNDADATTGWAGSGTTPATDNTVGFVYEGTNSISTQHSNVEDEVYTTSIGGTRDLSDATLYYIVKDNLLETYVNGGMMGVVSDGTTRRGYFIAGNNATGIQLDVFWNGYKLDLSRDFHDTTNSLDFTFSGSGIVELTKTAVTAAGVGTVHLAKAQGNVDNIKVDRMTFIANGSYAFTINGGTSAVPETMFDVVADSISNGWGTFANPLGSQFVFFAPTQWGNPTATANSYFEANGEEWVFLGDNGGGHAVDEGNFPFRVINNTTDTASFKLTSVSLSTVGTRATLDMSSDNIDTLEIDSCTFNNMGQIDLPPAATGGESRFLRDCTFNNCDPFYPSDCDVDNVVFNGHSHAYAMVLTEEQSGTSTISNLTFNRGDSPGSAVLLDPTGSGPFTYNFDNWVFNEYSTTTNATTTTITGNLSTLNVTGTSHSVNIPNVTINAGDLILIVAVRDDLNDRVATVPAGWYKYNGEAFRGVNQINSIETATFFGGSPSVAPGFQVFGKIADGTEQNTSISITFETSQTRSYNCRVYDGADFCGSLETGVELAPIQGITSTATTFDPAAFTPKAGRSGGAMLFCAVGSATGTRITNADDASFDTFTRAATSNEEIYFANYAIGSHNGYNMGQFSFASSSSFVFLPIIIMAGTVNAHTNAVRISENVTTANITINVQNGGTTPAVFAPSTYTGTVTINTAVTVRVDGVAEGTAIKVIADETVGTITKGDLIVEGIADSEGKVQTTTFNYESAFEPSGLDCLIRARNQGLAMAAIADDGGTQTDETAEANSPTTNDMTLTPAVPVVNDAYYFGHNEEFSQLKVWVTTAGADQTITWEYWNGAWTALSGVTDGTSSFTTTGDNIVSWTLPGDWADTTVNSQGPFRYVRARVSAIGGSPTGASGRQAQLDVTRYLPIPPSGVLQRTITSAGLTATLSQAVDSISRPFG